MELRGSIFKEYTNYNAICITTNGIIKNNGRAVMGAGVAKACRDTVKDSDLNLAKLLKKNGNCVQIFDELNNVKIIAFPTKNNWRDNSDIELIKKSCEQLVELMNLNGIDSILLPRPGCTNGNLSWNYVKSIIKPILDNRVTFISR